MLSLRTVVALPSLAAAMLLPAQTTATLTSFGAGCYDRAASFYETFPVGTFDLSGGVTPNTIRFYPNGNGGCVALPGSGQWFTPTSPNLGLSDDSVTGVLPLPLPHLTPAGWVNQIVISSNGFVWLAPNSDSGCCTAHVGTFLAQPERIAVLWQNLNPSIGGTIHYDTDAAGNAYATWVDVPEFHSLGSNTCQIAILAGLGVELRWLSCGNAAHAPLVGWTRGHGARDPGPTDLSATPAFVTSGDRIPLALVSTARPRINSTFPLIAASFPAGAPLGAVILSLTRHVPGIDLTSIGMGGCFQHVGLDVVLSLVASGAAATVNLSLPNHTGLLGVHFYGQAVAFAAGQNTLGVISSNAIDFGIGNQ